MLQKKLGKEASCWKNLDDGDSNFGDLPTKEVWKKKVPRNFEWKKAGGGGRQLEARNSRQTIGGRRVAADDVAARRKEEVAMKRAVCPRVAMYPKWVPRGLTKLERASGADSVSELACR